MAASAYYAIFEEEQRIRNTRMTKAIKAQQRSNDLEKLAPEHVKAKAKELLLLIQSAYIRSRSWINYNVTDVTIKIENPPAADRMASYRDKALMDFCRKHNTQVRSMGKSLIYHIPH